MTVKETVGFVGLGIMGLPMSLNLIKAGHPLVVYNRTRSKTQELAAKGAAVADSPKEVAQHSSVVIVMVSDFPRRGRGGSGQERHHRRRTGKRGHH